MVRTFRPAVEDAPSSILPTELPTDRPVAIYYRQSTFTQVGNVSTVMQMVDLPDDMKRRGWSEENIILIDSDAGMSGAKRIDERPGMSRLMSLIESSSIAAVACQDEDRLFRDVTQIQVNTFIEACRASRVWVITPFMTYIFHDEVHGDTHKTIFRLKSQQAADYLKFLKTRLGGARKRLMKEGRWAGAKIPVGYMADMRQALPNGAKNPDFRRFLPFEPFAKVVREHFRIYLEAEGNLWVTMQRLRDEGISFPDPKLVCPPEGFRTNYQLKLRNNGYYIKRTALKLLLTNPVYIGHWHYKDVVTVWNNHEPIVPKDTFAAAYNYLSQYDLTGKPNKSFNPLHRYRKPDLEARRDVAYPLCRGLVGSSVDGNWLKAKVIFRDKRGRYLYMLAGHNEMGTQATEWVRAAEWIDRAVSSPFLERVQATIEAGGLIGAWEKEHKRRTAGFAEQRKVKVDALRRLDAFRENLIANIGKLTDDEFVRSVQAQFTETTKERERLLEEIAEIDKQENKDIPVLPPKKTIALMRRVLDQWESDVWDFDGGRRRLLSLFIERIEASDYSRSGNMRLTIHWRDWQSAPPTEMQIGRMPSRSSFWSIIEIEKLLRLYDAGAGQLEVAATFPDRPWYSIRHELGKRRGRPEFFPVYLRNHDTYRDFLANGSKSAKAPNMPWRDPDVERLRALVDSGASQAEIMQEFPVRRWKHLRGFIKQLYGRLMPIPSSGIPQTMTWVEYAQQSIKPTVDGNSETEVGNF